MKIVFGNYKKDLRFIRNSCVNDSGWIINIKTGAHFRVFKPANQNWGDVGSPISRPSDLAFISSYTLYPIPEGAEITVNRYKEITG